MDAYLDIETTGLSFYWHKITVIGLCLGESDQVIQFVGDDIEAARVLDALERSTTIYTYNGSRFDLPFIRSYLGIDLASRFKHQDLMYDCWRCNLRGGLKAVERNLGIPRRLKDINGFEAVRLWHKYEMSGDLHALKVLLEYNKEDVMNLRTLRGVLQSFR